MVREKPFSPLFIGAILASDPEARRPICSRSPSRQSFATSEAVIFSQMRFLHKTGGYLRTSFAIKLSKSFATTIANDPVYKKNFRTNDTNIFYLRRRNANTFSTTNVS